MQTCLVNIHRHTHATLILNRLKQAHTICTLFFGIFLLGGESEWGSELKLTYVVTGLLSLSALKTVQKKTGYHA